MTVDHDGESGPGAAGSEQDIREAVRDLTAGVLKDGKVDSRGVEDVVRRMSAAATGSADTPRGPASPEERRALLDDLAGLDRRLQGSATAAHEVLARIAASGVDYTDNDLKEAFARLRDLQQVYVETVSRVADAASGNVQRELRGLAGHAQQVGTDASARVAALMAEFANRLNTSTRSTAASGFESAIDYGTRMSLLASGVLAGLADGLREHARPHGHEEPDA